MIWFTSDLHFSHDKPYIYEARGFSNVQDMDLAIIRNFKECIKDEDDLYILGDLTVGNTEQGIKYLKQIPGKIHIILGNHDSRAKTELYRLLPGVVEISYAQQLKYKKYHFFLCHYPACTSVKPSRPASATMFSLFGHTHQESNFFSYYGNEEINCRMYHVGVDSHGCRPVSIEQVIQDLLAVCPDRISHDSMPEECAEIVRNEKEEQEKLLAQAGKLVSKENILERVAAAQADGRIPQLTEMSDMDAVVKRMPELLSDLPADTPELKKAMCKLASQYVRRMLIQSLKKQS